MDRAILEEKQRALEQQFKTLNQQKSEHEKAASDIEAELFRLQGDFRTIQDLISKLPDITEQPDPALTIEAKEDTENDAIDKSDE